MINFNVYLTLRKAESQIESLSQFLAEAAVITVDQAKLQIMSVLQSIPMDNFQNATAKLTFLDQLMKNSTLALPTLSHLYKQEYPKYQQMQQTQQQQPQATQTAQVQQPQMQQPQAQPQQAQPTVS
jgi:arginine/lysine/ornithine decarboxylase